MQPLQNLPQNRFFQLERHGFHASYFNVATLLRQNPQTLGTLIANGDAADAMARIPTVMMWDDHDIFDGWGSYSEAMQSSPVFQTLFKHARRAFWVFQMQHRLGDLPALEDQDLPNLSRKDRHFRPISWQVHQAKDLLALPLMDGQPSFMFAHQVGPVAIVLLI